MLEYKDIITIKRNKAVLYSNIKADIQKNYNKSYGGDNSNNSEMADYFVYIAKEYKDLKTGDLIYFTNYFGENVILQVNSKDLIDYENVNPFIEILGKLI